MRKGREGDLQCMSRVAPREAQTTVIGNIFGGYLQSQVSTSFVYIIFQFCLLSILFVLSLIITRLNAASVITNPTHTTPSWTCRWNWETTLIHSLRLYTSSSNQKY